jgi:hypothetical protein
VQNRAAGSAFESFSQFNRRLAGETTFSTKFSVGAVERGFDFGAFIETPEGIILYLNEAKATAGPVSMTRFTSLGVGRGGPQVLRANLRAAELSIRKQFSGQLQQQLLEALRTESTIRLIGPRGFGVSEATAASIGRVSQRPVVVIIEK